MIATEELTTRDATTTDSLGHAFCARCYPVGGDVIVSLCGVLRDGQPVAVGAAECAVCESFTGCPRCGITFHKPWAVSS